MKEPTERSLRVHASTTAYVVVPGNIDDPAAVSGGNNYDRRVCRELAGSGWRLTELAAAGTWPRPGPAEHAELAGVLAAIPDNALVMLDGLVACAVPDIVVPESRRLRLVVLVHLPLADETGLSTDEAASLQRLERETLRAATAVIATSTRTGRRLVELHGISPARVQVVAPGVDPAPLAPGTDGASHLLCVAAVTPRKGHDTLIEALSTIVDRSWTCVCVGGLDRAPQFVDGLRRSIGAHHLADRVRLAGTRLGEDLQACYHNADLVVLASRAEPYGMVVTEALARGIAVLASAVDGIPEALGRSPDGSIPGILVPPGDPAALARAIRRWLTEPELRQHLRVAAHQRRATLTDWQVTAGATADALRRIELGRIPRSAA